MTNSTSIETGRTRDRILELLLRSEDPLTVHDLAKLTGISRNAAHQHVMALEKDELIEKAASLRTGGRPSQAYRLSSRGGATFPRQYALLSRQLLEELAAHLGPDQLSGALQQIGENLADNLRHSLGKGDRIAAIAAAMRDLGYDSHVTKDDGQGIEAHNCVFHDIARANPDICKIDLALLESLSGRTVTHTRCMARGERSCRFAFRNAEVD